MLNQQTLNLFPYPPEKTRSKNLNDHNPPHEKEMQPTEGSGARSEAKPLSVVIAIGPKNKAKTCCCNPKKC